MQIRIPLLMILFVVALVASGCIAADGPATGETKPAIGEGEGDALTANTTVEEILFAEVSWTLGVTGCLSAAVAIVLDAMEGVDYASVPIPSEAHGAEFNSTLTSTVAPIEWGIAFWTGDEVAGTYYSMGGRLDGTVPTGSGTAQFFSCAGAELDATFTVTA